MSESIFSFGTLQLDAVQQAIFGRSVPTTPDAVAGWKLGEIRIKDPEVIAKSGKEVHPALVPGNAQDSVAGAVLEVTDEELAAADYYERVSYRRIPVTLVSGRAAWVYVLRDEESVAPTTMG